MHWTPEQALAVGECLQTMRQGTCSRGASSATTRVCAKQYAWLPGFCYQEARAQALHGVLDRPRLYRDEHAVTLLEALANSGPKATRAGQGAGSGVPAPLFGTTTRMSARSATSVSATRQRKLHIGHFAFMRAVVQGLDPPR